MRAFSAIVIGFVLVSGVCSAHHDPIIMLKADATLDGLPSEYGLANLYVEWGALRAGGAAIKSITLNIRNHRVRFPGCLTGLFTTSTMSEIGATASWYHDESLLPYYLNLYFFDPGYDEESRLASQGYSPGFSLLLNLRTGKLMRVEVNTVFNSGRSMQHVPVDLAKLCDGETIKGFSSAPSQ